LFAKTSAGKHVVDVSSLILTQSGSILRSLAVAMGRVFRRVPRPVLADRDRSDPLIVTQPDLRT